MVAVLIHTPVAASQRAQCSTSVASGVAATCVSNAASSSGRIRRWRPGRGNAATEPVSRCWTRQRLIELTPTPKRRAASACESPASMALSNRSRRSAEYCFTPRSSHQPSYSASRSRSSSVTAGSVTKSRSLVPIMAGGSFRIAGQQRNQHPLIWPWCFSTGCLVSETTYGLLKLPQATSCQVRVPQHGPLTSPLLQTSGRRPSGLVVAAQPAATGHVVAAVIRRLAGPGVGIARQRADPILTAQVIAARQERTAGLPSVLAAILELADPTDTGQAEAAGPGTPRVIQVADFIQGLARGAAHAPVARPITTELTRPIRRTLARTSLSGADAVATPILPEALQWLPQL